jgi:16S rRNA (guanine966-N2)-methyltransferase
MRVIGGEARGRRLVAPPGREVRPTSDRVREALFSILADRLAGAVVLDLYAGSGALAIEALSRGAARAVLVERGRDALAALRRNLERTRLGDRAEVISSDVIRVLDAPPSHRYDLVILDPPYGERAIVAPLERLEPHLASEAVVVVKHFWRPEIPAVAGLSQVRQRRFGETGLTFLARAAKEEQ